MGHKFTLVIQPKGITVINHKRLSLSAGSSFRDSELTVPLCVHPSLYYISPVCTIILRARTVGPSISLDRVQTLFVSKPFHSHTTTPLPCSSPPTSVFNQLVPFISGNIGEKEFDGKSLTPSLESNPKTDFTGRPTNQITPICFQATIWVPPQILVRVALITGILFMAVLKKVFHLTCKLLNMQYKYASSMQVSIQRLKNSNVKVELFCEEPLNSFLGAKWLNKKLLRTVHRADR